ncbi:hypothetical protein [Desulfovibrio subterraneus]
METPQLRKNRQRKSRKQPWKLPLRLKKKKLKSFR